MASLLPKPHGGWPDAAILSGSTDDLRHARPYTCPRRRHPSWPAPPMRSASATFPAFNPRYQLLAFIAAAACAAGAPA
jgi:hypothetical protein